MTADFSGLVSPGRGGAAATLQSREFAPLADYSAATGQDLGALKGGAAAPHYGPR